VYGSVGSYRRGRAWAKLVLRSIHSIHRLAFKIDRRPVRGLRAQSPRSSLRGLCCTASCDARARRTSSRSSSLRPTSHLRRAGRSRRLGRRLHPGSKAKANWPYSLETSFFVIVSLRVDVSSGYKKKFCVRGTDAQRVTREWQVVGSTWRGPATRATLTYALLRLNISMVNTIMVTYCEHGTQSNARPCLRTAVHARAVAAAVANCSYRQPCTLGGWNPGVVYNIGHRELKRPAEAIQPV
jgi:hypothetical protein